jgi:hypothetical protein
MLASCAIQQSALRVRAVSLVSLRAILGNVQPVSFATLVRRLAILGNVQPVSFVWLVKFVTQHNATPVKTASLLKAEVVVSVNLVSGALSVKCVFTISLRR